MFRDLLLTDHRPIASHISKAKRAVGQVYRAVGNHEWLTAQADLLVAMAELRHAYEFITELTE